MQLIGLARLGRDVEVRKTPTDIYVGNMSLAWDWGPKNDRGERNVQWIDCALFGERVPKLAPYLKKGRLILATLDELRIEYWDDRDGKQRSSLRARVLNVEFAGSKEDEPTSSSSSSTRAAPPPPKDSYDDDIPF